MAKNTENNRKKRAKKVLDNDLLRGVKRLEGRPVSPKTRRKLQRRALIAKLMLDPVKNRATLLSLKVRV